MEDPRLVGRSWAGTTPTSTQLYTTSEPPGTPGPAPAALERRRHTTTPENRHRHPPFNPPDRTILIFIYYIYIYRVVGLKGWGAYIAVPALAVKHGNCRHPDTSFGFNTDYNTPTRITSLNPP